MSVRLVAAVAVVVLCTMVGQGLAQDAAARQPFSARERSLLASGKLVVRPAVQQRGSLRLIGGTSWQVINAPPAAVWLAVHDTPLYRRMLPQVAEVRTVSRRSNEQTLFLKHEAGPVDVAYHVHMRFYDDRRDATFVLDKRFPSDIRAAWGFFTVRPHGENRSLLSYGVMADVGDGIVSGFMRDTVHEWLLKVPLTIRQFVEGRGRRRYVR